MPRSKLRQLVALCALAWAAACGFGFSNDSGKPIPGLDYWGWQCADGSTPDPDAGCPPPDMDAGP